MAEEETQVMCRFVTRLPEEFRVTSTPIAVPAKLSRYGLSEVINHLLGLDKPKPFDFIVDGKLVRSSLEKLLLAGQISAEMVTSVEYIPAISPPQPQAQGKHEDWVSSVDASHSQVVVSGSYDGGARVWDPATGSCVAELSGAHEDSVTAVAVLAEQAGEAGLHCFTGSKDCTAWLWRVAPAAGAASLTSQSSSNTPPGSCAVSRVAVFRSGHSDAVECLAPHPAASATQQQQAPALLATGSWDNTIRLWTWSASEEGENGGERNVKKQKTPKGSSKSPPVCEGVEKAVLSGHSGAVAALAWGGEGSNTQELFSAGWDHTLRKWDAERGTSVQAFVSKTAIFSLSLSSPSSSACVALAGADKCVRLWDPRQADTVVPHLLTSHTSWVSCVRWLPNHAHHILSASHDNTVKLWDIRAKVPLHTIAAHTDKALCVDIHADEFVVSGGADCHLHINKVSMD